MDKYETDIAEILEVDKVEMNDELSAFQCWDSLTILSIIAFAGENYSVTLSAAEVNNSKTVEGLRNLIISKM